MCKIAIIPKVTKSTQKNAWAFSHAITPLLTKNDRDGLGYMALGASGLFGERWLNTSKAFKSRVQLSKQDMAIASRYGTSVVPAENYTSFGTLTNEITCIALHARMATTEKGLHNVHPFVNNDAALIHNGVINNPDVKKMLTSTCDSEVILTNYVDENVVNNIDAIDKVADNLSGYYACAVISKDTQGNWLLDVFKDDAANLFGVYVDQLKTIVFCTDADMIVRACKLLKWTWGTIFKIDEYHLMRHNARTGKLLTVYKMTEPEPYDYSNFTASKDVSAINVSDIRNGGYLNRDYNDANAALAHDYT